MNRTLHWLQSNLVTLGLAVLLGLTVWIVASLETNPVEEDWLDDDVIIDRTDPDPGLMIINEPDETTSIRLRAPQNTWQSISATDIYARADLSGLGPGTHFVQLDITVEPQAILVDADPRQIRVVLEQRKVRELPIQLTISGEPDVGYSADEVQRSPDFVTISGPESLVDSVSEIRAEANINDRTDTFRSDLPLTAYNTAGEEVEGITVEPSSIAVTIPIRQEAGFRNLPVRVVTTGRPASGYYITGIVATPQLITVQGEPTTIESLQPFIETQIIDLTNITDDLIISDVALNLPPDVTISQNEPVQVLITVAAQLSSRTLPAVPVEVLNLTEGLEAVLSTEEVEVILAGPVATLETFIQEEDIRITIDLIGLGEGTHQVEPVVTIDADDLTVESVFPITIEVEITPAVEAEE